MEASTAVNNSLLVKEATFRDDCMLILSSKWMRHFAAFNKVDLSCLSAVQSSATGEPDPTFYLTALIHASILEKKGALF